MSNTHSSTISLGLCYSRFANLMVRLHSSLEFFAMNTWQIYREMKIIREKNKKLMKVCETVPLLSEVAIVTYTVRICVIILSVVGFLLSWYARIGLYWNIEMTCFPMKCFRLPSKLLWFPSLGVLILARPNRRKWRQTFALTNIAGNITRPLKHTWWRGVLVPWQATLCKTLCPLKLQLKDGPRIQETW